MADELLTDDDLDNVVGGTWNDVIFDLKQLKELGVNFEKYNLIDFYSNMHVYRSYVADAFARYGVEMQFDENAANKYYIDGKEVTRAAAFNRVKSQLS